jgi:hypothetical protein
MGPQLIHGMKKNHVCTEKSPLSGKVTTIEEI